MANDVFMSALEVFEKYMDIKPVNIDIEDSTKDSFSVKLSFEEDTLSFENNIKDVQTENEYISTGLNDNELCKVHEWLDYIERTTTSKRIRKMCRDTRGAVDSNKITYENLYSSLDTIKQEYNKTLK